MSQKKWMAVLLVSLLAGTPGTAKPADGKKEKPEKIDDSRTPLHLLSPDYSSPYGMVSKEEIETVLDRVLVYLEGCTPASVENKEDGREITDYSLIDGNSQLVRGDFRLGSYEWGVTYSGMMKAAEATGDSRYSDYVADRLGLLARVSQPFRKAMDDNGLIDPQMRQILAPKALDDAGSMCGAMIKASRAKLADGLDPLIRNYLNYIRFHEYRLTDGTFARNRPQKNTVWLDDMYMSLPALAQAGKLYNEQKYYNEAAAQIKLFAEKMFVEETGLFRHGWVEEMAQHPSFYWGRANGWALLTLCEVLDVLPARHPERPFIMDLLKKHIAGIASRQSGSGAWHQLLDRNDSYLETSATAIFVYGIAHAVNNGWVDARAYGPVAQAGWNYITTQVNELGQVEGTCVGTGMAFDPVFYYHRPVNVYAAHGYGPVLLAGAEMIGMIDKFHPRMNDSAVQYYNSAPASGAAIFGVGDAVRTHSPVAGSTRVNGNPVIFLIGDSTVKNGSGKGDGGQWGWGSFFQDRFDSTRVTVENHALGGRSSRTFLTEGLWDRVLPALRPGDYVFIQFGHNDGGPFATGRARASIKGTGEESETYIMEATGGPEEVYTFGRYLRLYIRQAKAQGAIPIVVSPTPNNRWNGENIVTYENSYARWSREVAEQEGVPFIDLNARSAEKIEKTGRETAQKTIFMDSVHTSREGAVMNVESVLEGIRDLGIEPLIKSMK